MKWFIFRIIRVTRVDDSPGYVVQVAPPWFLRWFIGWDDVSGLQHGWHGEAIDELRRCEAGYNGSRGEVVR